MKKLLLLAALLFASPALAQPVQCPDQPPGNSTNACANTRFVINNGGGGSSALPTNQIFVGNASNIATAVNLGGDCTIIAAGTITCTKTNGTSFGTMAAQNANSVAITGGTGIFSAITLSTGTISGAPAAATDIANKSYVDSVASGRTPLAPVRLATAAALPANTYANGAAGVGATLTANAVGALTVDSTSPALNDRILVKNEAAPANNGCYTLTTVGTGGAAYVLTRCTDADTAAELPNGLTTLVSAGTVNISTSWTLNQPAAITVGTTALPWIQTGISSVSYWTLSGSDIYNNNVGNVAVGTTASTVKLTVYDTTNTATGLRIQSGGAGGRPYTFYSTDNGNGNGGGKFGLFDDNTATYRWAIEPVHGNFGIGTTAPTARLDVQASSAGTPTVANFRAGGNTGSDSAPTNWIRLDGTIDTTMFGNINGSRLKASAGLFLHAGDTSLTATNQWVSITPSGTVGIGPAVSPVAGATLQVGTATSSSGYVNTVDPTLQQAVCYGFGEGNCETDGFLVHQHYTGAAATTGAAIRGELLMDRASATGIGVSGVAKVSAGIQSEIVGVIGVTDFHGIGQGASVWGITSGDTGANSPGTNILQGTNRASFAPDAGLMLNLEGSATAMAKTAIDATSYTSFGMVLRNTLSAAWNIYITNNVGAQIYGVRADGTVFSASDSRLKQDRGFMPDDGLAKISMLKVRKFIRNDDKDQRIDSGFFAQEVRAVIPEAVIQDDNGYLQMTNGPIIAYAVKAIQELKVDNDNLRACQSNWKCRIFGWRP